MEIEGEREGRRAENSIWSNAATYQTSVGPHLPRLLYPRSSRHAHIGDIRSRTHQRWVETARWLFDSKVFHPANISPRKWIELLAPRRTKHTRKLALIGEKGNERDVRSERVVYDNVRRVADGLVEKLSNMDKLFSYCVLEWKHWVSPRSAPRPQLLN